MMMFVLVTMATAFCYAETEQSKTGSEDQVRIYNTSKAYQEREFERQIKEQLLEEGCTEDEIATILNDGLIMPLNDTSEYKHEYSDKVTKWVTGYASGIPSGGVYFEYGGSFYYEPTGGNIKDVTIGFGGKYGSVGFSVPLGKRSSKVTAYVADVPAKGFYKLKVKNNYQFQAYIIYKKVWNDAGTYTWQKFSSGKTKTLLQVMLIPEKVS